NIKSYIPSYPVGYPEEVALMITRFESIARILIGIKNLKIFAFGPRPFNFLACNTPIKPLFDLGVEIQENSELDLYESFVKHENDKRIPSVIENMNNELCGRNNHPAVMERLAQFELTLLDWKDNNLEASKYAAFADKCWPAFQTMFKFVPCFVNSRMAAMGYPVACETDIYGALSEYILYLAAESIPTLLDINNTVPRIMYEKHVKTKYPYSNQDIFMGFHCGNTSTCNLNSGCGTLNYQKIMKRLIEPDTEPDVSRGTLEGTLKPGNMTLFRLQSTADAKLRSYIAKGEVLDVDPKSFGSIGVIAIPEMARFYRHVLIEKQFPHHAGVSFDDVSSILFDAMNMLNVEDISFNRPANMLYNTENPF
ncbi:MAG TPA: fucose isomerase, partial [Clostridia bacterium]|nr:fucose isomerase [Clostridia bacterium]